MSLSSRIILLGVSGGIAAYKACELTRRLADRGAQVHVVMSPAACQFVTPMTFQALSGNPVHTDLFNLERESKISHIRLADLPDLIVVAPATADLLAKVAHGLCDDLLSTLLSATTKKVLFCPAMNVNMWNNPATQENISLLKRRGFLLMEPASGSLACGYEGIGRLPEPEEIVKEVEKILFTGSLAGLNFLITAGPTWEAIDPVRHITSPASGKTGFALAERARDRGASVTLISGPTHLPDPKGVRVIRIHSASEMAEAVFDCFPKADLFVSTAAVSDFRPKTPLSQKTKKQEAALTLELARNEDILARVGQMKKKDQIVVGFAAETQKVEEEARRKLQNKNLDLICANDVSQAGLGFAADQNQLTFYWPDGRFQTTSILPKSQLAEAILDTVEALLKEKKKVRPILSKKK